MRQLVFAYGLICYLIFFGTFLYGIGFLANFGVPKTLDSGPVGPLGTALGVNAILLTVFALQHSVMARPGFKRWWTRKVPAAAERSTYVLASCLALGILFWQWRPIGGVIWDVPHPIARGVFYGVFGFGWLLLFYATCVINHFDLFGLRQVWLHLQGKEYQPLLFVQPRLYRMVRHPLYVGWLITFWAAPTLTSARFMFAAASTAYILLAIQFEERDLVSEHGSRYAEYRQRVPMLIPVPWRAGFSGIAEADRQSRGAKKLVKTS